MTAGTVVFLLSLLLGIQPVTTDLYLPALPALTSGFGAKLSQAQLTLTGLHDRQLARLRRETES